MARLLVVVLLPLRREVEVGGLDLVLGDACGGKGLDKGVVAGVVRLDGGLLVVALPLDGDAVSMTSGSNSSDRDEPTFTVAFMGSRSLVFVFPQRDSIPVSRRW